MVKAAVTDAREAERALALSYAPEPARDALAALLALDDRMGAIVRRATEPVIGLMRLTWWADALAALDAGPPPAEPLLRRLAASGVSGAALAGMVDGWERLLDGAPLDLAAFARERGGRLFAAAAGDLADDRVATLGEGWALADLAARWSDAGVAAEAARLAEERLAASFGLPWPKALRALGSLGLLARSDLRGGRAGAPARVGRLLLHRLTGR